MAVTFKFRDLKGQILGSEDPDVTELVYDVNGEEHRIKENVPEPNREAAALTAAGSTAAELNSMIASFGSANGMLSYFNALQQGLKIVLENGTAVDTFFPNMLSSLQDNATYYGYYLNMLSQMANISQGTLEGTPTTAQKRQAYQVAVIFSNTGMIRSIFAALYG